MNFLKNQPKDKLQKTALVAIVILIAVGATYQFYIVRQRQNLREADEQASKLQTRLEEVQRQAQNASVNEAARQQLATFVDRQLDGMIQGDPFAWVVRSVSLLGQTQQVRIINWRPGQRAKHLRLGTYETFSTRLEIEGRYDQIGLFLQELENRFPTAEVRSLDITDARDGVHLASIDLMLLIRPNPTIPAEKDTKKAAGS